jgi:signal transduction histidine kinase
VQLVASGYPELSLQEELRKAAALLTAAHITVDTDIQLEAGELANRVSTLLATVLREGITNVLQHSTAKHCAITMVQREQRIVLEIVNDGAGADRSRRTGGTGISNLSHRMTLLGGELVADVDHNGRFILSARVPT